MAKNVFTLRALPLSALCVKKKRDVFIVPKVKDKIIEINGLMAKNVFTLRALPLSALCVKKNEMFLLFHGLRIRLCN
jgi:hypothetical protein